MMFKRLILIFFFVSAMNDTIRCPPGVIYIKTRLEPICFGREGKG
jgi:hypothetical protein